MPVSIRLPSHFQRGMPPAIARSSSRSRADDHVGPALEDRRHHLGHERWLVLVVGVDHDDHVGAVEQRAGVAGLLARRRSRGCAGGGGRRGRGPVPLGWCRRGWRRRRAAPGRPLRRGSRPRRRESCARRCRPGARGDRARAAAVAQQRLRRALHVDAMGDDRPARRGARGSATAPSGRRAGQPLERPARASEALGQARAQRRAEKVRTSGTSVETTSPLAASSSRSVARGSRHEWAGTKPHQRRPARRAVTDEGSGVTTHSTPPERSSPAHRSTAATGSSRCSSTSASTTTS